MLCHYKSDCTVSLLSLGSPKTQKALKLLNPLRKNFGVKVDPELHNQIKSAAPIRGLNVEGAYDQALRQWLDPSRATVSAGDKWVTLLREVLKSEFAPALQENLKAFARAAKYADEHWRPSSKDPVEDLAHLEDPIEEIERATFAAVERAERAIQDDNPSESQTVRGRKRAG